MTLHTEIEEEHFYPVMREAGKDTDMIAEAYVEHASAKQLIAELENGDAEDEEYAARFKVLGEYVKHHIKEEENEIFPQARRTRADFEPLLEALVARDEAVMAEGEQEGDSASTSSGQSGARGGAAGGGGRKRAGSSQARGGRSSDSGAQSSSGSSTRGRRGRGGSESAGQSQSADRLGGSEADKGTSGDESGGEASRRGRRGSQEESADTDSGMRGRDAESVEPDTRGSRQGNR